MLNLGKFLVNSIKLCNNGTKLTIPKFSSILRNMETFAPKWESDLAKAVKRAKDLQKPVMLVVYRPWCTYCQYLSRQISSSNQLKQMEPFFVMAQINEDETFLDDKFAPDGGVRYVPRVLFLTPDGEVMKDIRNHKSYKDGTLYVYNEVKEIMDSMNEVVRKYFMVSPSSENKNKDEGNSKRMELNRETRDGNRYALRNRQKNKKSKRVKMTTFTRNKRK